MASLCRLRNLSALQKLVPSSSLSRPDKLCRLIHTSDKKKDVVAEVKSSEVPKTWVSWGFSETNYQDDRDSANAVFFWGISVALCGTAYLYMYYPDMNHHSWVQREAYLELRRREEAGEPLIDPNYVSPSQVVLPSDEELGKFEIII